MRAAITPGTQPHIVNIVVINMLPQPLSRTARGGKTMHNNTRKNPIFHLLNEKVLFRSSICGFFDSLISSGILLKVKLLFKQNISNKLKLQVKKIFF